MLVVLLREVLEAAAVLAEVDRALEAALRALRVELRLEALREAEACGNAAFAILS